MLPQRLVPDSTRRQGLTPALEGIRQGAGSTPPLTGITTPFAALRFYILEAPNRSTNHLKVVEINKILDKLIRNPICNIESVLLS